MKQFMYVAVIAMGVIISCNETPGNITGGVKQTDAVQEVARGKYLVEVIGCNDCHTPKKMTPQGPAPDMDRLLSGYDSTMPMGDFDTAVANSGRLVFMKGDLTAAAGPWGVTYAANLTPDDTGLGGWTFENFRKAIKEGKYRGVDNSRPLMPPMPTPGLANLTDEDVKAIYSYLKTIKPVKNLVPPAKLNPPPPPAAH